MVFVFEYDISNGFMGLFFPQLLLLRLVIESQHISWKIEMSAWLFSHKNSALQDK